MPTESEQLFEEFCRKCKIPCDRIGEQAASGLRRPDYAVLVGGQRIVVEVKQFDPNKGERRAIRALQRRESADMAILPGKRVRRSIDAAASQLRALSGGVTPAMVVVYNNVLTTRLHTDPYSIATAMRGLDMVPVVVPHDPSISPQFQATRSGGERRMTENHNTTISAIGVLARDLQGAPMLEIFHNCFARNPIEPSWMRHPQVEHYRIPTGSSASVDGWERT